MGLFSFPTRQASVGPKAQCKMGPLTLSYPNVIGYSETVRVTQKGAQWTDDTIDGGFLFLS